MKKIKAKIQEFRLKRCIRRLRREFCFWGYDLSQCSDEEIKRGVLRVAEIFGSIGIKAATACEALKLLQSDCELCKQSLEKMGKSGTYRDAIRP